MKKSRPFFLSILLYSLLIVLLFILAANIFFSFSLGEMDDLYAFFHTSSSEIPIKNSVYASHLFIIVAIFSVVQMLRNKIYGLYVFSLVSILIIAFLLMNEPLDLVNILVLIIINIFLFAYKTSLKPTLSEDAIEQDDTTDL